MNDPIKDTFYKPTEVNYKQMKQLILAFLIVLLLELALSQCANPKPPSGGPIDSIPPILVETFPPQGSLNVDEQEITLFFNERINAEKLPINLIITPNTEMRYKTITKKNSLVLKFEEKFPDSTTITLNFFDGVTDIHERTPAINLTYVFSTGNFIDSMVVSGNVYDLMTASPRKKILVGLFPFTDTLDIFTTKPIYFTSSDEEGEFKIPNIKIGTYKLVAFADNNRNLLFDASQEAYGFLGNPISLDSSRTGISIPIIKENASKLKFLLSRALGNNFEIQYSKGLSSVKLSPSIHHNIVGDAKSVRIYRPISFHLTDTIQTRVTVTDSLESTQTDTVAVTFTENRKKVNEFTYKLKPSDKKVDQITTFSLTFNKPVKSFHNNLIHYAKDSTISIFLDSLTRFDWNDTYTKLLFTSILDTANYFRQQQILINNQDTFPSDTLNPLFKLDTTISTYKEKIPVLKKKKKISYSIDLNFPKGTFISIEDDTLDFITNTFSIFKQAQTGTIYLTITTDKPSYTVQLINSSYEVLKEVPGKREISFKNLIPAEYGIRILIDDNADGHWSKGNILKNKEPESVYLLPGFTSIRANWENPLNISF